MKRTIYFVACFLILFSPAISQSFSNSKIISVKKTPDTLKKLKGLPLDFLMERDNKIYINARMEDWLSLSENFIPFEFESNSQELSWYPESGVNGAFHSYSEIEHDLLALENTYPHLAKVYDIGDSLEGRNIYALKISDNVHMEENEARIILIGCHHAREWISVEVPYYIAKYLVENYDSQPEIKNLVDKSETWFIPLLNPDGLEYSINFYRYWRKNRRNNNDGTYGVDLNRNYGFEWGYDNEGSSPDSNSNIFRGMAPFSEPESQAVRDLFAQNDFRALISFHSYSQIILYPWGHIPEPSESESLLNSIAASMASLMEPVNGRAYDFARAGADFYLANGTTTDWSFGNFGIPSFTFELPPEDNLHGGFFNAEEEIQLIFNENLPAALFLIKWAVQEKENEQSAPFPPREQKTRDLASNRLASRKIKHN
jgi:hypothetical protein